MPSMNVKLHSESGVVDMLAQLLLIFKRVIFSFLHGHESPALLSLSLQRRLLLMADLSGLCLE